MSYPIYKEFDSLLTNDEIDQFYKFISIENINFETAQIYDRKTDENKRDDALRKCKECLLTGEALEWLDNIITKRINTDKNNRFVLMKNKARIISYDETDFFGKHTDVINVHSSEFKNYSLLMNLEPCEEGGETALYINDDFSYVSKVTGQKRGGALLFPKTLLHEGLPIKKGKKVILFVTYACFLEDRDFIVVTVESENFVIPVSLIIDDKDLVYTTFYNFKKRQNKDQHIFMFKEDGVDLNTFRIFYDDLMTKTGAFDLIESKEDYDNIHHHMDYLGHKISDLANYDETVKNFTLEVYEKNSWGIIKESVGKNTVFAPFQCSIITFKEIMFVSNLKVNDELIFCTPNIDVLENGGDFGKHTNGWVFMMDLECDFGLNDCFNTGFNTECSEWGEPEGNNICLNCLSKFFKIYNRTDKDTISIVGENSIENGSGDHNNKDEDDPINKADDDQDSETKEHNKDMDLETPFIKACQLVLATDINTISNNKDANPNSNEYDDNPIDDNRFILQTIEDFFDRIQDEENNNTQFNGSNEGGKRVHPETNLKTKIVKQKVSNDLLENIKFSKIFSKQDHKVVNTLLDPFKIITDVVANDKVSVVQQDMISGYSGKSNWDYVYQIGKIYGILNTEKYMI